MNQNKHIERRGKVTTKIFDNRSLEVDYRTLQSILQPGMSAVEQELLQKILQRL